MKLFNKLNAICLELGAMRPYIASYYLKATLIGIITGVIASITYNFRFMFFNNQMQNISIIWFSLFILVFIILSKTRYKKYKVNKQMFCFMLLSYLAVLVAFFVKFGWIPVLTIFLLFIIYIRIKDLKLKQDENNAFVGSFPKEFHNELFDILKKIRLKTNLAVANNDFFEVSISGENIKIPNRSYIVMPDTKNLTKRELLFLNCYLTRNCNGYIRQKSLRQIFNADDKLIAPFVIKLLGEYVIEILDDIKVNLTENTLQKCALFVLESSSFYTLTKQRVTSYWSEYYRRKYYEKNQYVGFQILNMIDLHVKKLFH